MHLDIFTKVLNEIIFDINIHISRISINVSKEFMFELVYS